ncbi:DUF1592 domain-containing protein [Bradyrhizobium brasilense]|uniref:DUF1592 domain-containing protein n=1 Tax=Bradyrhizobium brasilense TaxID=1419277 RepID=UPI001E608AAB|nr:DUF1592 domain-containing protein [Bradyrhizobium brasilense]MCC8971195.1 DUF1592 domain-containing protein [Bradyrhizobium brasilense]
MKVGTSLWTAVAIAVIATTAIVGYWVIERSDSNRTPEVPGGFASVRLISADQYVTAIHDIFGEDIKVDVAFAPPQRLQGLLALGASAAAITPGALDQFERTALTVAQQVIDDRHRKSFVPCMPISVVDPACARQFFIRTGRFLYRRSLTNAEMETQVEAAGNGARRLGDFYAGLTYSLAGMLTSPKFLYFIETTEPDPEHSSQHRLTSYSKATRLSLFLWNAPPDETLLDAAEKGDLENADGLKRQIDRMLSSPRIEKGIRAFFWDLLRFDQFATLAKDPTIYPGFTIQVARSAEEQMLRLITDQLITRNGDYRDLFTRNLTFINATLGPLYRSPASDPDGWTPHEVSSGESAGLLTSPGFLALYSHPGKSSPTRRGRAVRENLLCQHVPDPPPNVSFEVFDDANRHFKTARDRLDAHRTNPVCAGCHKITDPIGLALENFDGAGAYRKTEGAAPIDVTGELDGRSFVDVSGFGLAVHDNPALVSCLVNRLYSYGIGRPASAADRPWLDYEANRFGSEGYRLIALLRDIASSKAFYAVSVDSDRHRDAQEARVDR